MNWKKKLAAVRGKTVIGLTGPIASGKSLALGYFAREGALAISTDALAGALLTTPACYNKILRKFVSDKILTNGLLDKKKLAAEVFNSPAKRRRLEAILHPEILKRTYSLIIKSKAKIAVVEAPLLFEAGLGDCFAFTVCLAADEKVLRKRALARGWTPAQYGERARAQLPASRKRELADLTLENSGSPRELEKKIKFICRFLSETGWRRKA